MDETKIELPAWLPWATTACLAALVACLCELWIIERTRTQLLRDENLLAETSLRGAQNQLEAERIISKREVEQLRAGSLANAVTFLYAPGAPREDPFDPGLPWGVANWNAAGENIQIRFIGLTKLPDDRDYQCWIEGSGPGLPSGCVIPANPRDGSYALSVALGLPAPPGTRILLIDGAKGGAKTLEEAKAKGSIILASLPPSPKISK